MLALLLVAAAGCSPDAAGTKAIGRVDAVEGSSSILHDGARSAAVVGAGLEARDSIETGTDGKIRIIFIDASVLAIGAGTHLALSELQIDDSNRSGRIDVAIGKFWMQVSKWQKPGSSRYEIATPNAVAGVRGTTLWGDTQVDAICALEGSIEVRSLKQSALPPATLSAGNCASALSQGKLEPMTPSSQQLQRYLGEVLIGAPVP